MGDVYGWGHWMLNQSVVDLLVVCWFTNCVLLPCEEKPQKYMSMGNPTTLASLVAMLLF